MAQSGRDAAYEEGAFTGARRGGKVGLFELAHTGTLFLDEIADISPGMQVRLLRAIERNEIMRIGGDRIVSVDVRIISSTQTNLFEASRDRKFRSDLFFRLATLKLDLPPLRDRMKDLPALVATLFTRYGRQLDPEQKKQLNGLANYSWPGNIRELDSIIRTYLALRSDLEFDEEEFTKVFLSRRQLPVKNAFIENLVASASVSSLKEQISAYEAKIIGRTLDICANNRTEAAKRLGISVNSLWRKSRRQQLDS